MTVAAREEWRALFAAFVRFGLIGLVNTVVGFAVIVALMAGAGWTPLAANVGGYGVGLTVSYLLNRRFLLPQRPARRGSLPRFVLAFLLAYGVNLGVLWVGLHVVAAPAIPAQAVAVASYAVVFFLLCRFHVFR